jgi:hypothetical protein
MVALLQKLYVASARRIWDISWRRNGIENPAGEKSKS